MTITLDTLLYLSTDLLLLLLLSSNHKYSIDPFVTTTSEFYSTVIFICLERLKHALISMFASFAGQRTKRKEHRTDCFGLWESFSYFPLHYYLFFANS